jgi:hypothetical protein
MAGEPHKFSSRMFFFFAFWALFHIRFCTLCDKTKTQKRTKTHKNTQKHTKTHKNTQKHTQKQSSMFSRKTTSSVRFAVLVVCILVVVSRVTFVEAAIRSTLTCDGKPNPKFLVHVAISSWVGGA